MAENLVQEINYERIEEIKAYLVKSVNHFGGARFSAIMKEFTDEEKIIIFTDSKVLKKVLKIDNYEILASLFRSVPSQIQEMIWEQENLQKVLLGLGNITDEQLMIKIKNKKFFNKQELQKKEARGEFYYNTKKLRALDVLLRYVKSSKIINSLNENKYFQMILVASKKVPDSLYRLVDVERIFNGVVNSEMYRVLPNETKENWCTHINQNTGKLLLPPDYRQIYTAMTDFSTYFWGKHNILGVFLESKLRSLRSKNMKLDLSINILEKLNIYEINVLKSNESDVVDQEVVNKQLEELVLKGIEDGSIYSDNYLNVKHLDVKVQCAIFKLIIENTIGNDKYEPSLFDYLFSKLFQNEYSEDVKNALIHSLKIALVHTDEDSIANLFYLANDVKSVFFLRFNLTAKHMDYLNSFTVDQLLRINVKHVNRLVKLLYDPESDELSDVYSLAIKMYFVFGLEKSVELASKAGFVNKTFRDNVGRLNVKDVKMKLEGKKYLPIIHEEFNRFLFVADNITALEDKETSLNAVWYYLYNHFDEIKDTCHGHINLYQAETILKEQVGKVKYDLPIDCYCLEPILYEAGLGNKSNKYSNDQIYGMMCDMYRKQVRKVKSTIPYVSGTLESGWRYEVMRSDDVIAYVLGYRASCCIRTGDIAHNHLLHALHSEYGRILLTYKPNGEIASFSPLKRNGELLIANSIEAIEKGDALKQRIIDTFQAGIEAICNKSIQEEGKSGIKVATIETDSIRKPDGQRWPENIPTPTILDVEKKDSVYFWNRCLS